MSRYLFTLRALTLLAGSVMELSVQYAHPLGDLGTCRSLQTDVGANVTAYGIDAALKPFYGSRPWGVNVFVRFRLKPGA